MRMSCNGCRVLRKGCSDDCSIRPCLGWIKSPEAQANATVFLAKFYGRAGLMNLINAGPDHLRPGIFRSLLHEACGRIVNPIYGSVGLLWSGNWQLCQAAASHHSSLSHQSEVVVAPHEGESKETESNNSEVMTFSPPAVQGSGEIKLDLTLGLEPVSRADHVVPVKKRKMGVFSTWQEESSCKTDLVL
ncbi:BnaA01g32900D [Brassica napus]|uniref:BnaA01g32900D protein n=1 Tax=Brassica napus TaxID=3708 RepID=A0A078H891_BRANA|nr:BnaA01g32900D [Brassica napus]